MVDVDVRTVEEADVPEFRRIHNRYIDRDESLGTVREWYEAHPELLLGAYDDGDELVGHCLGLPRTDERVELNGIAVRNARQGEGIGTELLATFEERASSLGYRIVGLGSAGGYVDEFYVDNGYHPESILVRLDDGDPGNYRDRGYEIVEEKAVEEGTKLYVDVDGFDPKELAAVRETFEDPEAVYIMRKRLE